ncbi:MAG: hypothetical protein U9R41_04740 [Candidatus Marinimicrobia bacterium]|nr:hypothetical protein [Candidatus Neomarinimicrobiota bacterium]
MRKKYIKILFWITIFSIAMAFLETSVVAYLRKLYYPEGFTFPLKIFENKIGATEFLREFATIVMLISVAVIVGKNKLQRFAYFIYIFAIWDIFYYVFLKIILNWPESLFTFDILFLIPVTWVGPIIAPIICSITMILFALSIIYLQDKNKSLKIKFDECTMLVVGSIIVVISFLADYFMFLNSKISFFEILTYAWAPEANKILEQYTPQKFNWLIFISGILIIFIGIIKFILRNRYLYLNKINFQK